MPAFRYQNPQYQWKVLADKQYQQSRLRQAHEAQIQKQLKQKYLQQLSDQIKNKHKSISFEKTLQKSVDKIEIQRAIQNQRRNIQIQKLKNSIITEKTNKIDAQNLSYEKEKRQRQKQIKELQQMIENSKHQEAELLINYQKQKQQKKKQYFRLFLKQTMHQQQQRKKILQYRQRQLEKAKLAELNRIQARTDEERQRQLLKLKQRAKKVDYGSHKAFQLNQNKSLIQKKSQQWQIFRDSIEREQALKKMQQQQRIGRKVMQNYYQKQLKNQISQRQHQKRQKQMQQAERDKNLMKQSQNLHWVIQAQKRNVESQKKKVLYQYLRQQQQERSHTRKNQNAMRQQQFKINSSILYSNSPQSQNYSPASINNNKPTVNSRLSNANSSAGYDINSTQMNQKDKRYSTIDVQNSRYYNSRPAPGDTFRLDPFRLKQLQTVSKSLRHSDNNVDQRFQIDSKTHRYFATKGLNVLN